MPRYRVVWVHKFRGEHIHHFDTLEEALWYWQIQNEYWPETVPVVEDLEAFP